MTLKQLGNKTMTKPTENASIEILGDSQENERLNTISTEVISEHENLSTDNIPNTWDNYSKFTEKQSENDSDNTRENSNEYIPKTSLTTKDLEIVNSLLETLGYKENDLIRIRGFDEEEKSVTISTPYPLKELYLNNKTAYYYLPNSYGKISNIPEKENHTYYGYKQAHIPEGRTHYMEFDNLTYEEQLTIVEKLKLPKPTLAIYTGGKSIHYYWILKTPTEAKKWRALQNKLIKYLSTSDNSLKKICQLMRLPQCSYFSSKTKEYSGKETKILEELCDRTLKYNPEDLEKVIDENTPKNSSVIPTSVNNVITNPDQVPNLVVLLHELDLNLPTDDYLATALEKEYLKVANLTDDRNNYLNIACFNLGQLVNQGLNKDLIETVMIQASHINGKVEDSGIDNITNTIKSGIESGIKKPRSDRPQNKEKDSLDIYKKAIKDTTIIDTLKSGFDGILVYEDNFLDWYFYDDKVKHFDKKSEIKIKSIIRERRIELSKSLCKNIGLPEDHPEIEHNPSSKNVTELYDSLKMIFVGEIDNSLHGYLPLANGMLNLETLELKNHNPNFKNTYCLPHKYDPEAKCPQFLNWLTTQALNNPENLIIIQAFFYATLTGMGVQKFLELIGRPRSGKGTLMRVLTTLMGNKNSASVELDYMETNRFIMTRIIDKRLVAISETEQKPERKITRFLALTGKDPQTIEEKGKPIADKDKTFQGLVLFASNYRIEGNDPAGALDTRRITVHMDNVLDNEDNRKPLCEDILGTMTGIFVKEMSGILNWALSIDPYQAKLVLLNPEKHVKNYKMQVLDDELEKSDRLPQFLEDRCVIDSNGKVRPLDVYNVYSIFCANEGSRNGNTFKDPKSLMSKLRPLLQKYKVKFAYGKKYRDNKGSYYEGFRFKEYIDEIGLVTQAYTPPEDTQN